MDKVKNYIRSHEKTFSFLKAALPYLFPLFAFISLAVFLSTRSDKMLDSDMSSELILGKLLAENGGLLSEDWYYSTELRVLNTQIVYSTLFRFTDDFHIVRYLGSLINSLIYAGSSAYLTYHIGLKKYIPFVMGILLMPFSNEYFKMMLYASYYVPHVAISFVFLGMLFAFLRSKSKKGMIIYGSLMAVLSFVSCLGGLRQLCILFVPLLGASMLILLLKITKLMDLRGKEKLKNSYIKLFLISLCATIIGAVGYLINQTVFREYFTFHKFSGIEFTEFSSVNMSRVFSGFCELFGGDALTSGASEAFTFFFSIFLFMFTVYAIIYLIIHHNKITDSELIIAAFSLLGILVMAVIYGATNFEYTRRYLLPVFISFIPLLAVYIKNSNIKKLEAKKRLSKLVRPALCLILVLILSVSSVSVLKIYDNYRPTKKLEEMVNILMMKECYKGYATFWNANVMTELSNGAIEVRTWYSNEPVSEIDRYHNWLHVKDFKEDEYDGKLFLLFTKDEYNESTLKDSLDYSGCYLSTSDYVLFIYDNYDDIFK